MLTIMEENDGPITLATESYAHATVHLNIAEDATLIQMCFLGARSQRRSCAQRDARDLLRNKRLTAIR